MDDIIKRMVYDMCLENIARKQAIEELEKKNKNPDHLFVLKTLCISTAIAIKSMTEYEPDTADALAESVRVICGTIYTVDKYISKILDKSESDILKCKQFDEKIDNDEFMDNDELSESLLLKIVQASHGEELDIIRNCLSDYYDAIETLLNKLGPNGSIGTISELKARLEELQLPKETLREYRNEFIDNIMNVYYDVMYRIDNMIRGFINDILKNIIDNVIDTIHNEDE